MKNDQQLTGANANAGAPSPKKRTLSDAYPQTAEGLAALDEALAAGGGGTPGYAAVAVEFGVSAGAVKKHRVRFPAELKEGKPAPARTMAKAPTPDGPGRTFPSEEPCPEVHKGAWDPGFAPTQEPTADVLEAVVGPAQLVRAFFTAVQVAEIEAELAEWRSSGCPADDPGWPEPDAQPAQARQAPPAAPAGGLAAPVPAEGLADLAPVDQLKRYFTWIGIGPHEGFSISRRYEYLRDGEWREGWSHYYAQRKGAGGNAELFDYLRYGKNGRTPSDKTKGVLTWWYHQATCESKDFRNSQFYIRTACFKSDPTDGRVRSIELPYVERIRAYATELDGPLDQQQELIALRREQGLIPNAEVFSGGKSIHLFFTRPSSWETSEEQDAYISKALCVLFQGDPKALVRNNLMRVPGCQRPGGGQQQLLNGRPETYGSYEELRALVDQLLAEQGIADADQLQAELTRLRRASEQRSEARIREKATDNTVAESWTGWTGWSEQERAAAKIFTPTLNSEQLLDFLAYSAKALVEEGSPDGQRWDDGTLLTLSLRGSVDLLTDLGLAVEQAAADLLQRFVATSEAIGGPVDRARLQDQYERTSDALPGRTLSDFMHQLWIHTSGQLGERRQDPKADPNPQRAKLSDLIDILLSARLSGGDDYAMEIAADILWRFKLTSQQLEIRLFRRLVAQLSGVLPTTKPKSLDLDRITGADFLVPGYLIKNDLNLLYGESGTGKTLAALFIAIAVLDGLGFLDHEAPAPKGKVLFISSDSGASSLKSYMQDIGMDQRGDVKVGPGQRFHVWAADQDQQQIAWTADLKGCHDLLEFVKAEDIDLVIVDSCKAVCAGTNVSYTDNDAVTGLLKFFKEVIAVHTTVLFIHHDGTARDAAAGAKAWKEIPSAIHQLRKLEENGQVIQSHREWVVRKIRIPSERSFRYSAVDGVLEVCLGVEVFEHCHDNLVALLKEAYINGEASLSRTEFTTRLRQRQQQRGIAGGLTSQKTVDNALWAATRACHPEIVRGSRRGLYRLAPRLAEQLTTKPLERGLPADLKAGDRVRRQAEDGGSWTAGWTVIDPAPGGARIHVKHSNGTTTWSPREEFCLEPEAA